MAIDVPYHYESAPRMVQNVQVESQNNWYLGAHRQATDIKPLRDAQPVEVRKDKETAPTWETLPGKQNWQVKSAAAPKPKASKRAAVKRKPLPPAMCTEDSKPGDNCLPPK